MEDLLTGLPATSGSTTRVDLSPAIRGHVRIYHLTGTKPKQKAAWEDLWSKQHNEPVEELEADVTTGCQNTDEFPSSASRYWKPVGVSFTSLSVRKLNIHHVSPLGSRNGAETRASHAADPQEQTELIMRSCYDHFSSFLIQRVLLMVSGRSNALIHY